MFWGYWRDGPNSPGAAVTFRRGNILFCLSKLGEPETVVALARQIDALVRDDRQIAPTGTFAEVPDITSPGVPDSAQKNARITIAPEFRGLGDRAALRVAVVAPDSFSSLTETTPEGKSRPQVVVRGARPDGLDDSVQPRAPAEDGRFILHIPDKVGPLKLTMIVATPDNVIVTKDFTVNVTE
jgi:hypothetical protein